MAFYWTTNLVRIRMLSENMKATNLNLPINSNNSLTKKRLLMDQEYDIFYIVERLGAPLTQAFGI